MKPNNSTIESISTLRNMFEFDCYEFAGGEFAKNIKSYEIFANKNNIGIFLPIKGFLLIKKV